MFGRALGCIALLAAGCAAPLDSDWMLADRGYSINVAPYGDEFEFRVHVNELKQHGGDVHGAQFRLYVSERIVRHGVCTGAWEEQLCNNAPCDVRTSRSVTLYGRCVPKSGMQAPG